MAIAVSLILNVALAFIPARIAEKKGRSFNTWYVYGFLLFIVALIHAALMEDLTPPRVDETPLAKLNVNTSSNVDAADVILKYKELLDAGAITESEYETLKKRLM